MTNIACPLSLRSISTFFYLMSRIVLKAHYMQIFMLASAQTVLLSSEGKSPVFPKILKILHQEPVSKQNIQYTFSHEKVNVHCNNENHILFHQTLHFLCLSIPAPFTRCIPKHSSVCKHTLHFPLDTITPSPIPMQPPILRDPRA
jgi:hypothetical protein